MYDPAPLTKWLQVNVLTQIFFLFALAARPSPYRWLAFFPICGADLYLVFFSTSGSTPIDYCAAFLILGYMFLASDYILLTNVQHDLRLTGQTRSIVELPLKSRLAWAFKLLTTPRCIGWSHEQVHVLPARSSSSRRAFLTSQMLQSVGYIMFIDVAMIYNKSNPCYARDGPPMSHYGWSWRFVNFVSFTVTLSSCLNVAYCILGIISVATGISKPWEWPPLFGKWRDAYTVRRFWGRTWHRLMRRFLTSHSQYLAHRILRLRRGTNASSYVQLYTSFLISALIHYAGDYVVSTHWGGGSPKFFMMQVVAITFEDAMMALGKMAGIEGTSAWPKLLGYMWVGFWSAYSLPVFSEHLLRSGVTGFVPHFSLIMGLWRGEWFPEAST